MKTTRFRIIVAVIALCLLFTSCLQQPVETLPPETQPTTTPTTAPTTVTTTVLQTQPTEPTVTESVDPKPGTPLTSDEILSFEEMFAQEGSTYNGAQVNYYNRLLSCRFESPEQVDFTVLFLDQDADEAWPLTETEIAFLEKSNCDLQRGHVVRVSSQKIDTVLQTHLGITLGDAAGVGQESMVYFPETDCYYYIKYSFGELSVYFEEGTWLEDGKVELRHNRNGPKIMTLKKTDTGYIVLSNMREETDPTQPYQSPETTPATQPTETTEPGLDPVLWKTTPQYLSYDAFFVTDRIYESYQWGNRWIAVQDDSAHLFTVSAERSVIVQSAAFMDKHIVPNSSVLQGYELLGANGADAYLCGENRIIQLDLLTGDITALVEAEQMVDAYLCGGAVLYYAYSEGALVYICRLYVPDMVNEVLHSVEAPSNLFWLNCPKSTLGDITWTTVNQQMLQHLKDALADPNSKYQKDGPYDYSDIWKAEDALTNPAYVQSLKWICYHLQNDTGTHALLQGQYHCTDGSYTEKKGIFDDCSFGSSYPHDHFSPDVTTADSPVIVDGSWTALPEQDTQRLPEQSVASGYPMIYGAGFIPGTLYWNNNGSLVKLTNQAVTEIYAAPNAVYCISENGSVLELSQDGSICNTIYTSRQGMLRELSYKSGILYVLDGDTIVALDIPNKQYRQLISHSDIIEMYGENNGIVYFAIGKGMYYQQYLYNSVTGTLEKTHRI